MREVALIGLAQTIFFILLIVSKKQKEIKDYFLTIFLFFVAAELLYRFLINTIPEADNKWLALFDIFYWSTFGPSTLLYIQFTIHKNKKVKLFHLIYIIPLIISLYGISDFYWGHIEYNSFVEYFNNSTGLHAIALWFWEFCSPILLIYALIVLIKHKLSVKHYFSDISSKDLSWLILLLSGFILDLILSYLVWILDGLFNIKINFQSLYFLPYVLTVYVFVIGYFGYKQSGIFNFDYQKDKLKTTQKEKANHQKYKKSGLGENERKTLIGRLKFIMESEKPFIEPDINIVDLARMLDTTINKLSQVINESFNKNFYNFVNHYRIEEVKQLLKKPENHKFTIISIAYDCGFSSKSSFYNAFKQNAGITPKEYLEKI